MPTRSSMLGAMDALRATVKRVVDSADPEGLLGMDSPTDEYDAEIALITGRLVSLSHPSPTAIEEILMTVWQQQFGPLASTETYVETFRSMAAVLYAEVSRG